MGVVGEAVWQACITELAAVKPGNVGLHGDGHDMCVAQFVASAAAIAPLLDEPGAGVGERVLAAVRATHAAVGCNTNLGIVLLAAPLARAVLAPPAGRTLRGRLRAVLAALTVDDTRDVFAAIRLAAPAGLGESKHHDVHDAPAAPLQEVMRAARRRDRIAAQYANGYRDVFGIGLPAFDAALANGDDEAGAATAACLAFLSRVPDSHICRKLGLPAARRTQTLARELHERYLGGAGPKGMADALLRADRELKTRGINPGTSADLTVTTILAWRLRCVLGRRPTKTDQEE
ncbi:MAG: triphosphoribosyl-dephospho-CoA synthase [Planctomycetes bacterium]|nr:triphosphoribosyl-dephospho-CoA synthase [Planctomycetota bacterium]